MGDAQVDPVGRSPWFVVAAPVWLLTLVMAVAAAALTVPYLPASGPGLVVPEARWWLLLLLFAVAEVFVIHLPVMDSSHSLSLREIPAVTGLTFLSGTEYTSAYVLGASLALILWWRQRGLKLAFNAAMFALEASVGLMTYTAVLGGGEPSEPRGWVAALVAVLVTDLLSAAAVTTAISVTDHRFDDGVLREALRSGLPGAVINTCVAVLVVVLIVNQPSALVLLAVMVLILGLAYRVYVSVVTRYARLELLYRFVGSTGHTTDLDGVVEAVLVEAAGLLRASEAELIVASPDDGASRAVSRNGVLTRSTVTSADLTGAWWAPALDGTPVLRAAEVGSRGSAVSAVVGAHRDGLAVPVPLNQDVRATLLVLDRTFEQETFDGEDLRLLVTLAGHAAVTLDKAHLVDRLVRLADQREHEANHDALTDLPNRRRFQMFVRAAVAAGRGGAVLLIDLDDFKDVNDTLGHDAGDALLKVTARRLEEYRRGDVARLGGDEFAVLLGEVSPDEAMRHARVLRQVISEPVAMRDISVIATASIGVAPLPTDPAHADQTLTWADVAMYAAKAARSGAELYSTGDTDSVHRRLALAGDLAGAIARSELELHFQPQVDAISGAVLGLEALLRWEHPVHGPVPAPEVIAVAERTGLGRVLVERILEEALRQRAMWAAAGHDLMVSVNVTPGDLREERLLDTVARLLVSSGTPPSQLVIEITEHDVMTDPERCAVVLRGLRDLGVQLSVDDFGTGHSSLAYLERLPVHELKIDRTFVQRLGSDLADAVIVRATVSLAHELGLRVVAEGVENDHMLGRARELGCDVLQGYWIARPMPAPAVTKWLWDRTTHPTAVLD
jgi:diguanylate cyclase (GGDEF)-like protein